MKFVSKRCLIFGFMSGMLFLAAVPPETHAEEKRFMGSASCRECHEKEYDSFMKNSKKALSFNGLRLMKKGLTDEEYRDCLSCHTTGYGKPGGFESEEKTPDLMHAGCEVCHGPGSLHVESEDPEDIKGTLVIDDCVRCHNGDRVEAFDYKPMIFGGAH